MLQVARLSPKLLGASAELVRAFILRQQNEDGGFKDRSGTSDLYYTVFGLEGLIALQTELPVRQAEKYLQSYGTGAGLDFVHLCCLARCWAALPGASPASTREAILEKIETYRTADGGYHPTEGNPFGSAYGCFLAAGAYQDLKARLPSGIAECLNSLETADGAWANERSIKLGSTNATAAAITLLRQFSAPVQSRAGDWLLARFHSQGGFLAAPNSPIPDLLSTATALHALAGIQREVSSLKEQCLDFIDSLWTNEGAFHGHWGDDTVDCEYTYYGLLALGHLSV